MRIILAAVLIVVLSSCGVNNYRSVESGPRAKIIFTSPYLKDRFMSLDQLSLLVLEPNKDCVFNTLGGITVSFGTRQEHGYVRANVRAYFKVNQKNSKFLGSSSIQQTGFSFIPEENKEYIIEHIDNPANLRVKYYMLDNDGNKKALKVEELNVCKRNSFNTGNI